MRRRPRSLLEVLDQAGLLGDDTPLPCLAPSVEIDEEWVWSGGKCCRMECRSFPVASILATKVAGVWGRLQSIV
jgi:hypothetical protein